MSRVATQMLSNPMHGAWGDEFLRQCTKTHNIQSRDEFYKALSITRERATMSLEFSSTPN